jgi:hypothetical protein
MIKRSLLRFLPILLLSVFRVIGQVEMAQSAEVAPVRNTDTEIQRVQRLIMLMNEGAISSLQAEEAMRQLGRSHIGQNNPVVISRLLAWLKDSNPKLRSSAADALGYIGKPAKSAIPQLIQLLNDPDRSVRISSARALAQMGKPATSSLKPLIRLLKDSDPLVRESAAYALERIEPFLENEKK